MLNSYSVIARDFTGEYIFVGSRCVRGFYTTRIAEANATLFVVKLAQKYVLRRIIFEANYQVTISQLTKATIYFSDLENILDGILFHSSSFNFIFWSCAKRHGNSIYYSSPC